MFDINSVAIDLEVNEVERQISQLQFNEPEEDENIKDTKSPLQTDTNVSETTSQSLQTAQCPVKEVDS